MVDALIKQLEGVTVGSRELDAKIGRFVGTWHHDDDYYHRRVDDGYGPSHFNEPLHYTTSLDAAVKLIPKGWWWEKSLDNIIMIGSSPYEIDHIFIGEATTIILAICVASLKARQAENI